MKKLIIGLGAAFTVAICGATAYAFSMPFGTDQERYDIAAENLYNIEQEARESIQEARTKLLEAKLALAASKREKTLKMTTQECIDAQIDCAEEIKRLGLVIQNTNVLLAMKPEDQPKDLDVMTPKAQKQYSLDALAYAVAMHETHGCRDVTNFTVVNNCHGIRKLRDGELKPARYTTTQESYDDFKAQWVKNYKGNTNPTIDDAQAWSGYDRAEAWLDNVYYFMDKYNNQLGSTPY